MVYAYILLNPHPSRNVTDPRGNFRKKCSGVGVPVDKKWTTHNHLWADLAFLDNCLLHPVSVTRWNPTRCLPGEKLAPNQHPVATRWLPGGFSSKTSTRQFFTKKTTNPANYHIVLSRPGTHCLPGRFWYFTFWAITWERFDFKKKGFR